MAFEPASRSWPSLGSERRLCRGSRGLGGRGRSIASAAYARIVAKAILLVRSEGY